MVATEHLVWPCPAKPGDTLGINQYGILRHRGDAAAKRRDAFRISLRYEEIDRFRFLALVPCSAADASNMVTFQLWQTFKARGFDADRHLLNGRHSRPPRTS